MTLKEADAKAQELWGELGVAIRSADGTCRVGKWHDDLGAGGDFDCYGMGLTFEEAFERIHATPVVNP